MTIKKDELKASLEDMLEAHFGKTAASASEREVFCASAMLLREIASRQLVRCDKSVDQREVHYLSMFCTLIILASKAGKSPRQTGAFSFC